MNIEVLKNLYVNQDAPITTGYNELDNLLDGGIKPYYSYLIYGEAGTGKTFLVSRIIKMQLNNNDGYVLVISYKDDILKNIEDTIFNVRPENILYIRLEDLRGLNENLEKMLKTPKKIRLIVIDDFNHLIRSSVGDKKETLKFVWKSKKLIYRWGASLITITGVTQTLGTMEFYKPVGLSRYKHAFNYVLLITKIDDATLRVSDITRSRTAILQF